MIVRIVRCQGLFCAVRWTGSTACTKLSHTTAKLSSREGYGHGTHWKNQRNDTHLKTCPYTSINSFSKPCSDRYVYLLWGRTVCLAIYPQFGWAIWTQNTHIPPPYWDNNSKMALTRATPLLLPVASSYAVLLPGEEIFLNFILIPWGWILKLNFYPRGGKILLSFKHSLPAKVCHQIRALCAVHRVLMQRDWKVFNLLIDSIRLFLIDTILTTRKRKIWSQFLSITRKIMATTTVTQTVVTTTDGGGGMALNPWQFSLCSCCHNGCMDCLTKTCCLTCQYGRAMELAFHDSCCLCCLFFGLFTVGHWFSCCKRQQLRQKYQLEGSAVGDCLACSFCAQCHYLQMIHEIEYREGQVIHCCGDLQDNMTSAASTSTTVVTTTMER